MARGNKGKKGRKGDDSSDDDDKKVVAPPPSAKAATKGAATGTKGAAAAATKGGGNNATTTAEPQALSRKQKKLQKQQQKQTTTSSGKKNMDSDSDDDDDDDDSNILALIGGGKNKNKKLANRYGSESDDDEDDDDKYAHGAASKNNKKKNKPTGNKGVATKKASAFQQDHGSDSDDDDDDNDKDDEIKPVAIPEPVQKGGKNKNRNVSFQAKAPPPPPPPADDDSEEEEDFLEEEEDDDDDEEVEQIAFAIIDDDDDDDKKKKKKKKKDKEKDKDKKEKKSKKEKKEKKKDKKEKGASSPEEDHNANDQQDEPVATPKDDVVEVTEQVANISIVPQEPPPVASSFVTPVATAATAPKPAAPKPKTKLELQIEEAMRKKQAAEQEAESKAEAAARMAAEKERQEAEDYERMEREADEIRKKMEEEEQKELEEFYGHGDDAWNDKSAAQRAAELSALSGGGLDLSLTHGPDGKKLSNKERKKLIKDREAAARMAEYELVAAKASQEGAQFACSQTAVNEKDPQWENSLDINVPNFSISAAGKILFKDAILSITKGRRYGLVGPNGKGKSTLLKMIASGDLKIPPRIDFLYVEQEVVADDTPAVEAVLKADLKRWNLLKEEESLMKALDAGDEDMEKIERLQIVTEELTNMGADSAEAKARRILFGLGFDMDMQVKPTKMFSGGWRMRISLARALFVEPTLLMLDEPTNHLDLNAVIWLDDYLQRWKNTLLVVSHDQDFLNSVTQEILHIEDLKLVSYKGNYDSFKKAEKIKFEQTVKAWEKQEKRLRELKRSGQSKAKAQENVKKNAKREPAGRNNKKTNDAIASGSQTATQTELISRPKEYQVRFHFTDVADIGRPVMEINQVHFRYSPKHPVIFDKVDFGIDMDSRICIVGPNGAGKSTLLKLMTGEIEPTRGEIKRNPRLRMGVYNQHFVDKLPMNKTPIEFLRDRFQNEDYQSVRNRLGKYGLEGHAHEVVMRDLSGGQKARVTFVELSLQEPHLLLLDEPTNNLDIESIDALIDAINEFNGGIIVVTHDQRLIENCECNLWVVEKQKVTPWEKGFDDYKETLLTEMEEQIEKESKVRQKKLEEAAKVKAEKLALLASRLKR